MCFILPVSLMFFRDLSVSAIVLLSVGFARLGDQCLAGGGARPRGGIGLVQKAALARSASAFLPFDNCARESKFT